MHRGKTEVFSRSLTFLAAVPKPAAGARAAVRVRQAEAKPLAVQLGSTRLLAVSPKHSFPAGCEASDKAAFMNVSSPSSLAVRR